MCRAVTKSASERTEVRRFGMLSVDLRSSDSVL